MAKAEIKMMWVVDTYDCSVNKREVLLKEGKPEAYIEDGEWDNATNVAFFDDEHEAHTYSRKLSDDMIEKAKMVKQDIEWLESISRRCIPRESYLPKYLAERDDKEQRYLLSSFRNLVRYGTVCISGWTFKKESVVDIQWKEESITLTLADGSKLETKDMQEKRLIEDIYGWNTSGYYGEDVEDED